MYGVPSVIFIRPLLSAAGCYDIFYHRNRGRESPVDKSPRQRWSRRIIPPRPSGPQRSDRESSFPYPIRDTTGSSQQSCSLSVARQMSAPSWRPLAGRIAQTSVPANADTTNHESPRTAPCCALMRSDLHSQSGLPAFLLIQVSVSVMK